MVGDLSATGLADRSVDAIMCVDAIQFATPFRAAAREMRRVIRAGGRIALTSWLPVDRADDRMPSRLRELNPQPDLVAAGFVHVVVTDRPEWRQAERAMWEAALAVGRTDDPALLSMQGEAERVLARFDLMRRVLITAQCPD